MWPEVVPAGSDFWGSRLCMITFTDLSKVACILKGVSVHGLIFDKSHCVNLIHGYHVPASLYPPRLVILL